MTKSDIILSAVLILIIGLLVYQSFFKKDNTGIPVEDVKKLLILDSSMNAKIYKAEYTEKENLLLKQQNDSLNFLLSLKISGYKTNNINRKKTYNSLNQSEKDNEFLKIWGFKK